MSVPALSLTHSLICIAEDAAAPSPPWQEGLLKLHPQIIVEHGAMKPTKKYRGKMDSVILSYVKDMEPALKHARPDRVFITHSGCEPTIINAVRSYLEGLGIFREILETRAGGVISSHCGPNPGRFIPRILICLSFLSAEFTYLLPKRAGIFLSKIRSGNTQLPPALSEESGSAQQPGYPTSQDSYAHDHAAVFSSFQNGNLQKALERYLHKPDSAVHDHYCSQQKIDKRMRGFQRDNRDIKPKGPGPASPISMLLGELLKYR